MSHVPNESEPGDNLTVHRTEVKTWLTYETMSPPGRALTDIATANERSDGPAFDEQEVEDELNKRRGGHSGDGE
jgi:hypothetical protein